MNINIENIRLLLVDDEDRFRHAIAKRLTKRGISPDHAENSEECLSFLEKNSADVVVLDVKMPGMNGIETLKIIKNRYPETEVILLTGHSSTDDGIEGIKKGAFDYLTKPVDIEYLINKIKQAYSKKQAARKAEENRRYREKMEKEMQKNEKLASLCTLSAGIAHEINNPLAIINEACGWLLQVLKKEEMANIPRKGDFEKALKKIDTAVKRASDITHNLLFSVKEKIVLAEVNIKQLIEETIDSVKAEFSGRDIEFLLETTDDFILWLDPRPLRQILINIIKNAGSAIKNAGCVKILFEEDNNIFKIEISDNGTGIAKENLDKIFEPFFTTKPANEGSGLGLFVTKGLIEKLNGNININSRLGEGSTFYINIPIDGINIKKG